MVLYINMTSILKQLSERIHKSNDLTESNDDETSIANAKAEAELKANITDTYDKICDYYKMKLHEKV